MINLIQQHAEIIGTAHSRAAEDLVLPAEHLDLLEVYDGFVTKGGLLRVFPMSAQSFLPSLHQWNQSEWKGSYGHLAKGLFFFAEDIFGNQFGYHVSSNGSITNSLVRFVCEGGLVEDIPENGVKELLQKLLSRPSDFLDVEFVNSATAEGFRPSAQEHLAFTLPLVAGGDYDLSNVGVEDSVLHLSIVGQISLKNRGFDDGTTISQFVSE